MEPTHASSQVISSLHAQVLDAGQQALRLQSEGDSAGSARAVAEMEQALACALAEIEAMACDLDDPAALHQVAANAKLQAERVISSLRGQDQPLR